MLSHSNLEKFREDYYKDKWPGQRLGQAFMNNHKWARWPNPALFYDPSDERTLEYIRRNYVYRVANTWKIPLTERQAQDFNERGVKVLELQLQMSYTFWRLCNITIGKCGEVKAMTELIEVKFANRGLAKFIYDNGSVTSGNLLLCEVVV